MCYQILFAERGSRTENDRGGDFLAEIVVRQCDDRDFNDVWVSGNAMLDVSRRDVFPAPDDDVFRAPDHIEQAFIIKFAEVAGPHPAVGVDD